jgi:FAD/FMN-containing dehydrogenase
MTAISQTNVPIETLRSWLTGDVIAAGDERYDEARSVFQPGIDRRPAAIVRPVDALEVAFVVMLSRITGTRLAVRGGGHSSAGHGVLDDGIVLDLGGMRKLAIDPGNRFVWAEAGLTAGEVVNAAGAYGLTVPFGDHGGVGIGGLTLGGGVGYLARKHGLTVDSLLAAEVVTADGRTRHVDAQHDPDLFWAIRGGGGNFGVATRFKFRLHPVETVLGGMLALPATPATVAGFVAAAEAAPDDLSAIANVLPAPPLPFIPAEQHGKPVILAMLVHAGPIGDAEQDVAPFRALGPLADFVRPLPYTEMFQAAEQPKPAGAVGRTLFLDTVDEAVAGTMLERMGRSSASMAAMQLRVLGGAVARVPREATAFAHRSSRVLVNVGAIFGEPGETAVHEAWAEETAAALRQGDEGAYVNFLAGEGEERVRAAYPGATWERLRSVKRRYDPGNLFRSNQNIPPAGERDRFPLEAVA